MKYNEKKLELAKVWHFARQITETMTSPYQVRYLLITGRCTCVYNVCTLHALLQVLGTAVLAIIFSQML